MRDSTPPTMGSLGDGLQAEFMESAMAGSTSLSTLEGEFWKLGWPSKYLYNSVIHLSRNFWISNNPCRYWTMGNDEEGKSAKSDKTSPPATPVSFILDGLQAEFMESSMARSTSLSTPEGEVNSLMQQVADDYGLKVSVGQPQPGAHVGPTKETEKVHEDNLSRRLVELKAKS
ncbi:hypothetical protein G4B88_024218 [Cannabis sativa]|uniref:Uncharacterized protein n=1 Tax=Cannabis sativa TaxID=3483 RepID=A0A7J6FPP2_CANSA|nr:hypothetical protein G4B88_024218 [Cannabis sativa]